jgi:hypothetical protein
MNEAANTLRGALLAATLIVAAGSDPGQWRPAASRCTSATNARRYHGDRRREFPGDRQYPCRQTARGIHAAPDGKASRRPSGTPIEGPPNSMPMATLF